MRGSLAEIGWTVTPFVVAMVMFFWGAHVYMAMVRVPDNAIEVFVVGRQWMWKLRHMEGKREIDRAARPTWPTGAVDADLGGRDPQLLRPSVPHQDGRGARAFYPSIWFEANQVGEYHLFCAEYCGTARSRMIGRVVVMEPHRYQAWMSGETTGQQVAAAGVAGAGSMAATGASLSRQKGCVTCRAQERGLFGSSTPASPASARTLPSGTEVIADDAYLRESILNPQAKIVSGFQPVMPTFQGQLNEEEILQLLQYIKGLS